MSYDFLCHSLFQENLNRRPLRNNELHSSQFMKVIVNLTDTRQDVYVAVYEQDHQDINEDSLGHLTLIIKTDYSAFTYRKNSFNYLPSPYQTECIDYHQVYGRSRVTVVGRCVQERYYQESDNDCRYDRKCFNPFSFIPTHAIDYYLNYTVPDVHFPTYPTAPSNQRSRCYKVFQAIECHSNEYYLMSTGIGHDGHSLKNDEHKLIIDFPTSAGLVITEVPAHSMDETLTDMAGIVNFWFSVSVFELLMMLTSIGHGSKGTNYQLIQSNC